MLKWFKSLFTPDVGTYVSESIKEAQLAGAQHRAAAEHHEALAQMYEARVARLSEGQTVNKA